jgi:protein subunit release factor B
MSKHQHQNRSDAMNTMHEALARAQMSARLGEAQQLRAGDNLVRYRRLSRKAERAAQRARLALARAL